MERSSYGEIALNVLKNLGVCVPFVRPLRGSPSTAGKAPIMNFNVAISQYIRVCELQTLNKRAELSDEKRSDCTRI